MLLGCFLIFSCSSKITPDKGQKSTDINEYITVLKEYDKESNTTYYLTIIKHKDKNGKIIKLMTDFANKQEGETVRAFAIRKNTAVTINASMGIRNLPPNIRQPSGIQIIDGKIIQELATTSYTLGIKNNNELVAYAPKVKATDILKDGAQNALTGFLPLIENYEPVSEDILRVRNNSFDKHPRQVIAQFGNLDILILSCGGRGINGDGMTAKEMMRILKDLKVKFAFNLDGGGSVSTVIGDKLITPKIDDNGTSERLRPNFLYIQRNN